MHVKYAFKDSYTTGGGPDPQNTNNPMKNRKFTYLLYNSVYVQSGQVYVCHNFASVVHQVTNNL